MMAILSRGGELRWRINLSCMNDIQAVAEICLRGEWIDGVARLAGQQSGT